MTIRRDINELLAAKLAAGATIKAAAAELGIGEKTAYRRWADPGFKATVAQLQAELRDGILGRVLHVNLAAIDTLEQLLGDPQPTVRLKAAALILDTYRHVLASIPEPAQPTLDVSAVTELIARMNANLSSHKLPKSTYAKEGIEEYRM
jgi:hypothetical protein